MESRPVLVKTGDSVPFDEFLRRMQSFDIGDAASFQSLCELRVDMRLEDVFYTADPLSPEYKTAVLTLYARIKGQEGYDPLKDEVSFSIPETAGLFTDVSPWNWKDTRYLSEYIFSWGNIFKYLDLKGGQSVLEYGPGSGQLALMLARAGADVYGVDIDAGWLELIERQAKHLGLTVNLESNTFGNGFEGKTFDRILFFESFHHALDFKELLSGLKSRLNAGGYIVFCGEPVVGCETDSIPYAWGPRLDGASVYMMRTKGWMELGFTQKFFSSLVTGCGYDVAVYPFENCGRAELYTATPTPDGSVGTIQTAEGAAGDNSKVPSLLQKLAKLFRL